VDARDLAAFVLALADGATPGVYGVVDRAPTMTLGDLIGAAAATAGVDTRVAWVDDAFIGDAFAGEDHDPHEAFPLWWPEAPGFHAYDASRAFEAGLTCRPPAETVRDTLAWDRDRPQGPMQAGLDPDRERSLLEAWHATGRG
jgi:2'-hydroxyisoflavone reductase